MENKEIDKKLESKNVKPTAMRTLVYKTLAETGKALSLWRIWSNDLKKWSVQPFSGRLKHSRKISLSTLLMMVQARLNMPFAMMNAHVIYMTCTFIFIVHVVAEHVV